MRVFIIIFIFISSGCSIVYETPKCELMLRGEECLSDHRCCNLPETYYRTHPPWWHLNRPHYNKTIIINKPNNKPNNKPSITRKHRK